MTPKLWEIVKEHREKGLKISDSDAEMACLICKRKMEIVKIQNPDEYMPLLFMEELKNIAIRNMITDVSKVLLNLAEVM